VKQPSGVFTSRIATGGLLAVLQVNDLLVVPDFTIAETIWSPVPPSIENSRLLTVSSLTTRPSA
jgi:hypothetical protein